MGKKKSLNKGKYKKIPDLNQHYDFYVLHNKNPHIYVTIIITATDEKKLDLFRKTVLQLKTK